jgi:RimJ/RimL family protein N-acetyltransferase
LTVTSIVPVLATARLTLRPLSPDDVDALVPIYTDPEVTRYFRAPIRDRAGVQLMIDRRLNRPLDPGMGSFVFESAGEIVGIGHLWPSAELPAGLPEAGWLLGRKYWGSGLASEGARAIVEYGLRALRLPAVWALVHKDNQRSLALAARLGFLDVGGGEYHGGPHRVCVALRP